MKSVFAVNLLLCWTLCLSRSRAEVTVVVEHNPNESATAQFKFKKVPAPSATDAATKAEFSILEGERDENGGDLGKLHDGKLPTEEDQPEENFFFNAGTPGGRILIDLGREKEIKQINTYSWHPNTRAAQVYSLYASDGKDSKFNPKRAATDSPTNTGWKLVANVDTRPKTGDAGGQYGVSITDADGAKIGTWRYLLLSAKATETDDPFGNTFYSEIDVISSGEVSTTAAQTNVAVPFVTHATDGECEITIDTSGAPELKDWAEQKLAPMLAEWYPRIAAMLPSEGFRPPKAFLVTIKPGSGVAATGGTRITANSTWLKRELDREALGALLHEEVHVLQQYRGRRDNPDGPRVRPPGWLVEGIPDYIRWFQYEPQSHGADVIWLRARPNLELRYDARYRVTANFLNYVMEHYDKNRELLAKVNAACRLGTYNDALWKTVTGKTLEELDNEWRTATTTLRNSSS